MIQQPEVASKPIVTLTLSPTIDLAFQTNEIRPIRKNRAVAQHTDAGGGGINVARVLKELGAEAYAIYLAGGATGLVLDELVAKLDVPGKRIDIAGGTRISFTVFEEISGLEYRFVSEGSALAEAEWQSALSALNECDAAFVVASGSLPPGDHLGWPEGDRKRRLAPMPPPSRLEIVFFWIAGIVIAILSGAVAIYVIHFDP